MRALSLKFICLLFLFLKAPLPSWSQAVTEYKLPASYSSGMVAFNFQYKAEFRLDRYENHADLLLDMNIIPSRATNVKGNFSYRYWYKGQEYTDQDVGREVFHPINILELVLNIKIMGPKALIVTEKYQHTLGAQIIIKGLDKDVKASDFTAFIVGVDRVAFKGTEMIHKRINELIANNRKLEDEKKRKNAEKITAEKEVAKNKEVPSPSATISDDDFWEAGEKPSHNIEANGPALPELAMSEDGKYYRKGAGDKYQEIGYDEYQRLKKERAAQRNDPEEAATQKAEQRAFRNAMAKIKRDQEDYQAAWDNLDQQIEEKSRLFMQSYYAAEAVRNGLQNLDDLSRLAGNYSSMEALEADFNQKYNSINSEVAAIEQARNDKLEAGVNTYFNGNSQEQAIGQGIALIGGIVNNAKAAKEAKEAREALQYASEKQLAAIDAAKKKARLELRTKLLKSFPDGGTPLSSHKISQSEVYIFAYITDPTTFSNEQSAVAVSNVFPVQRYGDNTYPYKTTVFNKLADYASGSVTLVGYYTRKEKAEEMHKAFLNLAGKSSLTIKPFELKTLPGKSSGNIASGDFWETGEKPVSKEVPKTEKSDFWNN